MVTHKRPKATSAVPPSNKGCDDFIILFLFSKCFLVIDPSFCMYLLTRTVLFAAIQIFPPFFRGCHKIQRLTQDSVSTSGLLQGDTESYVTLWLIHELNDQTFY